MAVESWFAWLLVYTDTGAVATFEEIFTGVKRLALSRTGATCSNQELIPIFLAKAAC